MTEEVKERMILKKEGILLESESENQFFARGQSAGGQWSVNRPVTAR